MASFTLSGIGIQPLTPGTRFLYLTITTPPERVTFGSANPTNYYNVGLLRPGDSDGFLETVAIIGGPQRIDLPSGCVRLGYSIFGSGSVDIVEAASIPVSVFSNVDGTTVSNGTPVTITFLNVAFPTAQDWLTLQPVGEADDTANRVWGAGGFGYSSSGTTTPGGTALANGSYTNILTGASAGTYQARLYQNDTDVLLAAGPAFTVS